MIFKRKIMDSLIEWKNDNSQRKKAIVIKGLRQCGKTFIVKQFAEENYQNVIYINFKMNRSIRAAFNGDLSIDRLITNISSAVPSAKFVPDETILIFDEIQECANARASLKTFVEDGRYHVVCTGSLLGIRGYNRKRNNVGIPTGSEHIMYMKTMDFEEFLWARGISEETTDMLHEHFEKLIPIDDYLHQLLLRYFKEYICVGGLPFVVEKFLTTNDLNAVYSEQFDILEEYRDDFGKHLDKDENEITDLHLMGKINKIFDAIPTQIAKENNKFMYSRVKKGSRGKEYESAIQWLKDAGIISCCYNLEFPQEPLEGNKIEDQFKIYMQDTGLFLAMLGKGSADVIINDQNSIYKGAIFENIIADAFSKNSTPLYYYRKDSGLEIDFISMYKKKVTLIEAKTKHGNVKSSKTILNNYEKYQITQCIKLGEYNIGQSGMIITLPYYLSFLL